MIILYLIINSICIGASIVSLLNLTSYNWKCFLFTSILVCATSLTILQIGRELTQPHTPTTDTVILEDCTEGNIMKHYGISDGIGYITDQSKMIFWTTSKEVANQQLRIIKKSRLIHRNGLFLSSLRSLMMDTIKNKESLTAVHEDGQRQGREEALRQVAIHLTNLYYNSPQGWFKQRRNEGIKMYIDSLWRLYGPTYEDD